MVSLFCFETKRFEVKKTLVHDLYLAVLQLMVLLSIIQYH
jgi:hypothetical protein